MGLKKFAYRKLVLIGVILFCSLSTYAQTGLLGKWVDTGHREKQIEIYTEKNNKIYGKSDKGFIVLKDFVYDLKTASYTGTLVNPDDREEFTITIKQPSVNSFTFVVRKFIFSKKFSFEKITTQ